jgi:hypothetical protein
MGSAGVPLPSPLCAALCRDEREVTLEAFSGQHRIAAVDWR